MFDSLVAWAQAHPGQAFGSVGIVGFGLYAIYAYWDVIMEKVRGKTTVTTPKPGTVLTRREVLDCLDASYAYFQSVGCKEGMEAIGTAVSHAFHEHPAQSDATTGEAVNRIVNAIGDALKPSTVAPATVTTAPESH